MESNPFFILACFLILSFCSPKLIHGNKQGETLGRFQNNKLKGKGSNIDKSPFKPIHHVNATRFHYQHGMKERDKIERLPGQPKVGFSQYGGYVTVDKSAGRALYYYFVEAQNSKDSLPLLLWLNGGPGCSSLAYGAMQELGPFRVRSDGKSLYKNRFSWNYAANVLFLEAPAGVGFSYSNTTSDYAKSGDRKTAEDNYVFLVNWLERFPEYKNREFYISGESYAGHYVPQLAHTILLHNNKSNKTVINLKGILIGNAVINDETDTRGMYDYFGNHALISQETAQRVRMYCNFSPNATTQNQECSAAGDQANNDLASLNIYNIYATLCTSDSVTSKPKKPSLVEFDPCSDNYGWTYLNRGDVQEAMHANVTKLTHDWEPCSDIITNWLDSPSTILPIIHELMSNNLRVWIFSGDIDGKVPITSTQYSIKMMKLPIKSQWHPWFINREVGGYTQVYRGDLTLATVRGAGHQVPSYQPLRALSLVKHFLDGTPLPNSTR